VALCHAVCDAPSVRFLWCTSDARWPYPEGRNRALRDLIAEEVGPISTRPEPNDRAVSGVPVVEVSFLDIRGREAVDGCPLQPVIEGDVLVFHETGFQGFGDVFERAVWLDLVVGDEPVFVLVVEEGVQPLCSPGISNSVDVIKHGVDGW